MSVRALNWAKLQKTGQPAAKLILMLLADRARLMRLPNAPESPQQERCFPGADTLAAEAEVTERYIRDMLKILVGLGLVEVKARYKDGRRTTNLYTLAVPDDFEAPAQESPAQSNWNHGSGSDGSTGTMVPVGRPSTGTMVPRLPEPWFLAEPEVEPEVPSPPPTPSPTAAPSHTGRAEEGEEAAPDEPHPDAIAIIDEVDLGGHTLDLAQRAEAERTLTVKLADGWTRDALRDAFKGCTINAPNPVGVFMYRLRNKLNRPPAAPASNARASPQPGCDACERGLIEQPDRTVTRCHNCHPDHQGAAA